MVISFQRTLRREIDRAEFPAAAVVVDDGLVVGVKRRQTSADGRLVVV